MKSSHGILPSQIVVASVFQLHRQLVWKYRTMFLEIHADAPPHTGFWACLETAVPSCGGLIRSWGSPPPPAASGEQGFSCLLELLFFCLVGSWGRCTAWSPTS